MEDFDFENRILDPSEIALDNEGENPLRPRTMNDYIGQEKSQGKSFDFYRGCKTQTRNSRPCSLIRSSGTW